jgi:hypothetical protein
MKKEDEIFENEKFFQYRREGGLRTRIGVCKVTNDMCAISSDFDCRKCNVPLEKGLKDLKLIISNRGI